VRLDTQFRGFGHCGSGAKTAYGNCRQQGADDFHDFLPPIGVPAISPATNYKPLPPPAVAKSLTIVVLGNKPKNRKTAKLTKYFVFLEIIDSVCRSRRPVETRFRSRNGDFRLVVTDA
jgi:hypothetical protein